MYITRMIKIKLDTQNPKEVSDFLAVTEKLTEFNIELTQEKGSTYSAKSQLGVMLISSNEPALLIIRGEVTEKEISLFDRWRVK